jgi:hypothetical protein
MADFSFVDSGIRMAVEILNKHGFKTFESCQGGKGHFFHEPTVRFEGSEFDCIKAYEICQAEGLPVYEVKRIFRKTAVYKGNDSIHASRIGEAWETPFNEITFITIS